MKKVNFYIRQLEECTFPCEVSEEEYRELEKGTDPEEVIAGFYNDVLNRLDGDIDNREFDTVFLGEDDKAPVSDEEKLRALKEKLYDLISVLDDEFADAVNGGSPFEYGWYKGARSMLEKVLGKEITLDEPSGRHSVCESA